MHPVDRGPLGAQRPPRLLSFVHRGSTAGWLGVSGRPARSTAAGQGSAGVRHGATAGCVGAAGRPALASAAEQGSVGVGLRRGP